MNNNKKKQFQRYAKYYRDFDFRRLYYTDKIYVQISVKTH